MVYRFTHHRPRGGDQPPGTSEPAGEQGPNGGRRDPGRRRARRSVRFLPTLFTIGNLLCGFIAVFFASRPAGSSLPFGLTPLTFAAAFVFVGMIFDSLDGRIARLTHNTSDFGGQMDSMADMVTFGVAPALTAVLLVIGSEVPFLGAGQANTVFGRTTLAVAAIYVACAALRLARFNIETKSGDVTDHLNFKGLPTPGAAGTIASLVLLQQTYLTRFLPLRDADPTLHTPWNVQATAVAIVAVMLLTAIAMVSSMRYPHLINRYVRGGRARFGTVVRLVVAALLLTVYPVPSAAAGFVVYAVWGPIAALVRRVAPAAKRVAPLAGETEREEERRRGAG